MFTCTTMLELLIYGMESTLYYPKLYALVRADFPLSCNSSLSCYIILFLQQDTCSLGTLVLRMDILARFDLVYGRRTSIEFL